MKLIANNIALLGAASAATGAAAGVTEVIVGTNHWLGSKDDPTTLGWTAVGLAAVMAVASFIAWRSIRQARPHSADTLLASAAAIFIASLVGPTTAGVAWVPAAMLGITAGTLIGLRAYQLGLDRQEIRQRLIDAMLVLLATIYLAFGVGARAGTGALGLWCHLRIRRNHRPPTVALAGRLVSRRWCSAVRGRCLVDSRHTNHRSRDVGHRHPAFRQRFATQLRWGSNPEEVTAL
jgi:uncharacterized membrane protein SirB2